MKIKGAFPVRWAAQNGSDGKGVTIVKTEIKYAVSTSGTTKPSSGWQTTIPSVSEGNYLWTWTHVEYSDGTKTDAYSVSRHGIDGKGIKSSVTKYCQKADTNTAPHKFPESDWGDFPTSLTNDYWLYTRTIVTYSDNDTAVSYDVSQIGQGSYYAGCNEYYSVSNSKTKAPDGYPNTKEFVDGVATYVNGEYVDIGGAWSTDRPDADTDNPYIWNFEISYDSRGNKYVTRPICIGNFAKGIVSIVETYAISAYGSVPQDRDYPSDIKEADWTDEHFAAPPTNEKPYQWNKTVTTYNDGTTDTIYHVSAVKGIDGKGAVYIDLDNENDSMLYDGSGNRVSGDMVSNIKLYDNGADVTSDVRFSIESSSGVSASIPDSTSTLIVTSMTADSGHVIVYCIYKGVTYYARFTCKKIIGTDKYELVCTPSALTFNDDTDTGEQVTVTIQVYKTAQNGTRSLLQSLPTGYSVTRKWTDTQTTGTAMPYSGGKATFNPYDKRYDRYRIELLGASKNVLDYETIPICHVKNGEKGDSAFVLDADNENVGFIVEDTGIYSTAQNREIGISAYYGANPASEVTYSVSVEGNTDASGSNYLSVGSVTNGKLTISLKDKIAWKKDTVVKITVTATHAKYGTRSIVINCVPVFGGAKADYYDLLPSLSAITFTKTSDGKSLTPSSRTLTVQCLHVTSTGQTPVSIPSGYSVRYSFGSHPSTIDDGTKYESGLTIGSNSGHTMVYLSLFKGTTLIDKESVPIIKGGVDGADNIGVSINLDNDMSSFPMTYDGKTTGQTTHKNYVSLYVGNSLQSITSLEIEVSDSNAYAIVPPAINGEYSGDFSIAVKSGKSFTADKVTATVTVKSAECTDGRSIVFTLQGVRAGSEGKSAVMYELMPSVTEISFGRDGNNNLTPMSISVNCGYQKNDGGTITNYSGTAKKNLSKDEGAQYNMMYRFQKSDGDYTGWSWAKDLERTDFNVVIENTSTHLALEYILTSANSIQDINESNIVDRETIPIVRAGSKGDTGDSATNYWLVTSDEEVQRYQTAQLSVDKLTCSAKKKTGTGEATTASDVTIYYQYVEFGDTSGLNPYTESGVKLGIWWSSITFIGKVGDAEVARKTVYFKNTASSIGDNILNGTNFEDPKDEGTVYDNSDVVANCVGGVSGIKNDGFPNTDAGKTYKDFFVTAIHKDTDKRLLPATWYTLSFFAMAEEYLHITVGETKAQYGFAGQTAFFTKGSHKIIINGYISTAAKNAGKELRVFVYKSDWSWSASVATLSTSATNFELSFEIPHDGEYEIRAYVYHATDHTISSTSYTATVNWYRVYSSTVRTNINNTDGGGYALIDTSFVQVADGVSNRMGKPYDGNCNFDLKTEWTYHTFTFRTKPTIPTQGTHMALFRHAIGTSRCSICRMKLERGIFATDWSRSERDKTGEKGYSGAKPYFMKLSEIQGQQIKVYQGVNDEEWYTIVYDDVENTGWYTPKKTHTTTKDEVLTDAAKWLKSSMNFVATAVFFAQMAYIENLGVRNVLLSDGKKIEGGMCYSDVDESGHEIGLGDVRLWLGGSNPQTAPNRQYNDGSAVFSNGNVRFDENGNVAINNLNATNGSFEGVVNATSGTFSNGTFTNVKISGSMRCPFTEPSDNIIYADTHDNVILVSQPGPWLKDYQMPWGTEQSGRRITLINWNWGDNTSTGTAPIFTSQAEGGFWENGKAKNRIDVGREVVELLGYGTDTVFFGWIVLRRVNL